MTQEKPSPVGDPPARPAEPADPIPENPPSAENEREDEHERKNEEFRRKLLEQIAERDADKQKK